MVLYLGLELQSLALYVVAAFRRDSLRSTEAGLKYFVLGALSSGLLLYGASLTYGYAGTTLFAGIGAVIGDGRAVARPPVRAGVPRRRHGLQGLGRAVPHVDARRLRGLADAGDAVLRHGAQGRGAVMFAACSSTPSAARSRTGSRSCVFLSVASMFLGAVAAIGQRNIKRLMAYSSISHMGFALMGLAAGTEQGRAVAADLPRDLRHDERRRLRLHPQHGEGRQAGHRHRRARPLQPGRAGAGGRARRADVLARRACRRWSASSGSSTC